MYYRLVMHGNSNIKFSLELLVCGTLPKLLIVHLILLMCSYFLMTRRVESTKLKLLFGFYGRGRRKQREDTHWL